MEKKEVTKKETRDALAGEVDNVRDFPEETLCPSCGKFVGAYEKCPYCGATLKKRMALAIFKRGCLVMSVVGLVALWYAAVVMEPKLITVGEIGPTYNKGIFRVKGTVSKLRIEPDRFFKVQFWVDDGTGNLKVQTGDLEKLEKIGKLPALGDEVEAIGEVSLSAQFGASMNLKAPDRMKLVRAEIQTAKIGELEPGGIYSIYGEVVRVRESDRKVALVLGDETGIVGLDFFTTDLEQLPDAEDVLKKGAELELTGVVSAYRGKLGIKPASPAEVKVAGEDKIKTEAVATKRIGYEEVKLGSLKAEDKGKKVRAQGKISNMKKIPKATKFDLSDSTGTVEVTLWDSEFADYPNLATVVNDGNEVILYGMADEYKGTVQLSPQDHLDLQAVKKAAPPEKKATPKPTPKPTVKPSPKPTAKPATPKPTAKPAAPVTAPGEPEAAAEKKAVVTEPPPPAEMTEEAKPVETKPEAPPAKEEPKAEGAKKPALTFPPMKIGDITMEKDGAFAEITGEVVGSSEFSKGLKLKVKDDSGTIDVVLWTDLLEKLDNKAELTKEGAKLTVKGKIGSYRDEMQLSPRYPNQIKLAE